MIFQLGTEAHNLFHTHKVIPATVEKYHFVSRWQVCNIALKVLTTHIPVRRFAQHNGTGISRTQVLRDALDDTILTARIAAFNNNQNPLILFDDVFLQFNQFDL